MAKKYKEEFDYRNGSGWDGLSGLVAYRLVDGEHDGAVESAEATASNNSEALGRLLEVLHSKEILSLVEVGKIIRTDIMVIEGD